MTQKYIVHAVYTSRKVLFSQKSCTQRLCSQRSCKTSDGETLTVTFLCNSAVEFYFLRIHILVCN